MRDKINWDGAADKRLRKLFEANVSYREIADIFGCSQSAIAGRVHRLGLPLRCGHGRDRRAPNHQEKPRQITPLDALLFNGEVLTFAVTDRPCARCAVRESEHHRLGCGQFAAEITARAR